MPALSRPQLALYAALAVAALAIAGRWLAAGTGGAQSSASAASRANGGARVVVSAPARELVVHVAGAVRRPGVYRLRRGDRVQDAVRRAGGVSRRGDVNGVNLAAPAQDGVQIVVPARAGGAGVIAAPGATAAAAAPVNLNTATAEQLDTLDGVGPATATKILDYRRQHGGFRSVDDLGQVAGIGPKKLAALRGKVST